MDIEEVDTGTNDVIELPIAPDSEKLELSPEVIEDLRELEQSLKPVGQGARCPDHMAAPYLAQKADEHFQASIANVMKASQQNNLLLSELLPLITKLQREKAKFDELDIETCDLSAFKEDVEKIKTLYRMLKQHGHSLHTLAASASDHPIDQGDAEAYLNKIFPDDLDLEKVDQWQFEELKEQLSHWRDTVKRDIDFNTNSLFAVLQLYISCHNVMQKFMSNVIESRKKMTDNQIAR